MAKGKKKRQAEARNKKEGKQIFMVISLSTVALLVLLYFTYANS